MMIQNQQPPARIGSTLIAALFLIFAVEGRWQFLFFPKWDDLINSMELHLSYGITLLIL